MNRIFLSGAAFLALLPLGCGGGATESINPTPIQTPGTSVFRFPALVPSGELPEPYKYYYGKSPLPLEVHLKHVAVWDISDPETKRLYAVPVANQQRGSAGVEQFVTELVEQQPNWFVAPIFIAVTNTPVLPTSDILVKLTPTTSTAVFNQIPATSASLFAGLTDTYRVAVSTRNGFEVLRAANQLALNDSVVYAEVSFLSTGGASGDPQKLENK